MNFKVYRYISRIFPFRINCLLCKGRTTFSMPLCSYCIASFPVPTTFCSCCDLPLADSESEFCAECLQTGGPAFDRCLTAFLYNYPVDRVIQKIKYNNGLELISPMVRTLAKTLNDHYKDHPWPETIIPVPLHPKKLRTRGFNQAQLIAKSLIRAIPDCFTLSQCIAKKTETAPQQGLSAKKRRKNIKKTFSICQKQNYRHVAIIDDVVTTGATVSEISKLLKKEGVKKVDIWCLARTPLE